jgi:hypothetical protein
VTWDRITETLSEWQLPARDRGWVLLHVVAARRRNDKSVQRDDKTVTGQMKGEDGKTTSERQRGERKFAGRQGKEMARCGSGQIADVQVME